jgi:hypothetical protein
MINQSFLQEESRELLAGWRFCATLQRRTPLRILLRHNELVTNATVTPPDDTHEPWQGIWIPQTKSWLELSGVDIPDFVPMTMASEIGPVPSGGGEYLQFLIAVRRIVEAFSEIDERAQRLRGEVADSRWASITSLAGHSADDLIDYYFPCFLDTVSRLSLAAKTSLLDAGFISAPLVAQSSVQVLKALPGIGAQTAQKLIQHARLLQEIGIDCRVDAVSR